MVPIQVTHENFWHIKFKEGTMEWEYLARKLMDSIEVDSWNDYIVARTDDDGNRMVMLKKSKYPVRVIAKTFGITEQAVKTLEIIVLDDPVKVDGVPEPTVNYYGEA